jgi:hypothetical protein
MNPAIYIEQRIILEMFFKGQPGFSYLLRRNNLSCKISFKKIVKAKENRLRKAPATRLKVRIDGFGSRRVLTIMGNFVAVT